MTDAQAPATEQGAAGGNLGRVFGLMTITSPDGAVREVPFSASVEPADLSFKEPLNGRDPLDLCS